MPLFRVASHEQRVEIFLLVNFGLFLGVPRPVVLADQPSDALRLEERHHHFEFVVDAVRGQFSFVTQKGREFQQIPALDVFNKLLGAAFFEISKPDRIGRVTSRLLRKLDLIEVFRHGCCEGPLTVLFLRGHGNTVVDGIQLGFFGQPPCIGVRCIFADR